MNAQPEREPGEPVNLSGSEHVPERAWQAARLALDILRLVKARSLSHTESVNAISIARSYYEVDSRRRER